MLLNGFGGDKPLGTDLLLSALGISGENAQTIACAINKIISGEIDFKSLLPLALPIVLEFLGQTKQNAPSKEEAFNAQVALSPIESFTDESIYISLENYFDSESAS